MVKARNIRARKGNSIPSSQDSDVNFIQIYQEESKANIENELLEVNQLIQQEEMKFFQQEDEILSITYTESKERAVPEDCIPINADVRNYDFKVTFTQSLARIHMEIKGKLFDAIMMDPPWQLSGSNPTRGVTISYDSLPDNLIQTLPIPHLQTDGLIFIWTINAKYRFTLQLLDKWGYQYIDEVVWVKKTRNNKIAKSHGYWLQHAKETCIVGAKGNWNVQELDLPDVIFSPRRGQSQKPEDIYIMIEQLFPTGAYLEIFGRRNNLRNGWITIGNEI